MEMIYEVHSRQEITAPLPVDSGLLSRLKGVPAVNSDTNAVLGIWSIGTGVKFRSPSQGFRRHQAGNTVY
jgi:hypothetical protein